MSSNFSKKCLRHTHTHTQNIQVVEDSRLTTGVLKILRLANILQLVLLQQPYFLILVRSSLLLGEVVLRYTLTQN